MEGGPDGVEVHAGESVCDPIGVLEIVLMTTMSQGEAPHAGGLCGHDSQGSVLEGQTLARFEGRFAQLGKLSQAAEGFKIHFRVRFRSLAVVRRSQNGELFTQAQLPKKMLDFHPQTPTGNGQREVLGSAKDKLSRPRDGRQAIPNDLFIGVCLPGQQFIAAGDAQRSSVGAPEVIDDPAVIESEIVSKVFMFGKEPAFTGRHLLDELHDKRFAVNEDPVEIEDDSAQQEYRTPVVSLILTPRTVVMIHLRGREVEAAGVEK